MLTPSMAADDVRSYIKMAKDQIIYLEEQHAAAGGDYRLEIEADLREMREDLADLKTDLRRLEALC